MSEKDTTDSSYTCADYRMEMILLSLHRRLEQDNLSDSEKRAVEAEIKRIKAEMAMG